MKLISAGSRRRLQGAKAGRKGEDWEREREREKARDGRERRKEDVVLVKKREKEGRRDKRRGKS